MRSPYSLTLSVATSEELLDTIFSERFVLYRYAVKGK
jgi:hypothetical protein